MIQQHAISKGKRSCQVCCFQPDSSTDTMREAVVPVCGLSVNQGTSWLWTPKHLGLSEYGIGTGPKADIDDLFD